MPAWPDDDDGEPSAREPLVTRVLREAIGRMKSGEIVQPAGHIFCPQIPNPEGRRLTRLDLARWLVSPENPLTARGDEPALEAVFRSRPVSGGGRPGRARGWAGVS